MSLPTMKQYLDTCYYVTECGRVFSNKRGSFKELKLGKCRGGYFQIILHRFN